ncbi:hypothetical protein QYF36_026565 [Acer negundo]|nr:hypothetical protein QYF36_026565 [Acer negundo]
MSSTDELFLNNQIRLMKLSSHLQRPQILTPTIDLVIEDDDDDDEKMTKRQDSMKRGRDLKLRCRSLHKKSRSLSLLRNREFEWHDEGINTEREVAKNILELHERGEKIEQAVSRLIEVKGIRIFTYE